MVTVYYYAGNGLESIEFRTKEEAEAFIEGFYIPANALRGDDFWADLFNHREELGL